NLAHGRPQRTNASLQADKYHFDLVDIPGLLSDQILVLAVRSPRVLLLDCRDRHHAAMALLAAQPAEKDTHQEFRIETIGLRAPVFARHRDARRMDDIGLNIARPQPARAARPMASSQQRTSGCSWPSRFPISLGRRDLWRLFVRLRRVDDEFERVRILVLL